jgi:hypothetical protein
VTVKQHSLRNADNLPPEDQQVGHTDTRADTTMAQKNGFMISFMYIALISGDKISVLYSTREYGKK